MSYIMLKDGIEYIAETEHQKEFYEKKGFKVYVPGSQQEVAEEKAISEPTTETDTKKK